MSQADLDMQLKVWKELAISKQMLLRAATDALGLDPECTQEELKAALEGALRKVAATDLELREAKAAAAAASAALEKKLAGKEQELAAALSAAAESSGAHQSAVQQLAAQRAAAAAEQQKLKERLAEREKALKAINTALADTPANVLQKMNTLKKQKQEEAEARRQIDAALNALRAEKRQQDQRLTELTRNGETLVARYRDLHALTLQLHERLVPLVEDATGVPGVPPLDTKLLEALETPPERESKRSAIGLRAVNS